jgi:dTDP-4-dehydrorhamnose 3,5-epimerase
MDFFPTAVDGAFIIDVNPLADERGLLARTYDTAAFEAAGLPTYWPQCTTSFNVLKGTLRGMHYQGPPRPDPKLVRCTRGRIFDVVLDIRPQSPTYRAWSGVELSHSNRKALFVPGGCAHGFLTLDDESEVFYMMGEVYVGELARGVLWNDPAFAIDWPFKPTVMSARDAAIPTYVA